MQIMDIKIKPFGCSTIMVKHYMIELKIIRKIEKLLSK